MLHSYWEDVFFVDFAEAVFLITAYASAFRYSSKVNYSFLNIYARIISHVIRKQVRGINECFLRIIDDL